jgi:hypothetical protein
MLEEHRNAATNVSLYNVVNLYLVKASALHIFLRLEFQIKKSLYLFLVLANPKIRPFRILLRFCLHYFLILNHWNAFLMNIFDLDLIDQYNLCLLCRIKLKLFSNGSNYNCCNYYSCRKMKTFQLKSFTQIFRILLVRNKGLLSFINFYLVDENQGIRNNHILLLFESHHLVVRLFPGRRMSIVVFPLA